MKVGRGVVRCGLAALLFGGSTPLAGRIADTAGAPALAGLLYVGAALGVLPFIRKLPATLSVRTEAWRLGVSIVVGGLVAPLCLAAGLSRTSGATASLLLNLELVATVLLAGLVFREDLGRRVLIGATSVVTAGVVLAWSGAPDLRVGAVLVAVACLCWGVDNCVTANVVDVAPEIITLAKGVVAGATNIALAFGLHATFPAASGVLGALLIGALGYGVSITLWIQGARDLGAARGQLVFATAPFAGVAVAWLVLGEGARGGEVVALVLAGVGVVTVLRSDHEHAHTHHAVGHDHEHSHDDGHHVHSHDVGVSARHSHHHDHPVLTHVHPHVPDLHHRHDH